MKDLYSKNVDALCELYQIKSDTLTSSDLQGNKVPPLLNASCFPYVQEALSSVMVIVLEPLCAGTSPYLVKGFNSSDSFCDFYRSFVEMKVSGKFPEEDKYSHFLFNHSLVIKAVIINGVITTPVEDSQGILFVTYYSNKDGVKDVVNQIPNPSIEVVDDNPQIDLPLEEKEEPKYEYHHEDSYRGLEYDADFLMPHLP